MMVAYANASVNEALAAIKKPGVVINDSLSLVQDAIVGESHNAGDATAYEKLSRTVYIVGHVWTYSKNYTVQIGVRESQAELKCLRAVDS